MERKYELVGEPNSNGLYRIRALIDLPGVKKGDIGGFVSDESCLSHEGECWIFDDSEVSGNSAVSEGAVLSGNASVCSNSVIKGNAIVREHAICWNSVVSGDAIIDDYAHVADSEIDGIVRIKENARIIDGRLYDRQHIFQAFNVGREFGTLTVYRDARGGLTVTQGCFISSISGFKAASRRVHEERMHRAYNALLDAAALMIVLD